jgi:hypothetical protein
MPTITTLPPVHANPALEQTPRVINGVLLLTRGGTPKTRYSPAEQARILGGTPADLAAFADLFAPRRTDYSVTRPRSGDPRDWTAGRGRLSDGRIVRHLLGARLPGRPPQWVALRAWDWTRFVAIDVDLRGDRADFDRRCAEVETALDRLGVPPESRLVTATPSGGRHYFFFPNGRIRTAEITPTLALVGIAASKGRYEVFPSTSHAIRLPFGHMPGRPHDPDAWIRFVRSPPPGVNWEECKRRAAEYARASRRSVPAPASECRSAVAKSRQGLRSASHNRAIGLPKQVRDKVRRYRELLGRPIGSQAEAEELWRLGILEPGTRHEALLRVTWHFVFVRGADENEAAEAVTEWAYRTGATTSEDVRRDLARGTRRVEADVREMVRHFVRLRAEQGIFACPRLAAAEVAHLAAAVAPLPLRDRRLHGRFLLEFLHFAKSRGREVPGGWECQIAAAGVMRTWPGCSGRRYKRYLDRAREVGVIELTREKWRSADRTGRPRTFRIAVPATAAADRTLTRDDAWALFERACLNASSRRRAAGDTGNKSDTYRVGLPPQEEDHPNIDQAARSDPTTVRADQAVMAGTGTQGPTPDHPLVQRSSPGSGTTPSHERNRPDEQRQHHPGAAGDGGPGHLRGEHPRGAEGRLAPGAGERPPVRTPLQGLRDQTPGTLRADSARGGHGLGDQHGLTPGQEPPAGHHLAQTAFDWFRTAFLARHPDLPSPSPATWAAVAAIASDPLRPAADRALVLTDPFDLPESARDRRFRLILDHRLSSGRSARRFRSHRRTRPLVLAPPLDYHSDGSGRHRSPIPAPGPEPISGYVQTDQTGGIGTMTERIHPPATHPNGARR